MEHVAHCDLKNPLSQSIDIGLPGVKRCLKIKQMIFTKMVKVLRKLMSI